MVLQDDRNISRKNGDKQSINENKERFAIINISVAEEKDLKNNISCMLIFYIFILRKE